MKNSTHEHRKRNAGTSRSLSYQSLEPRQLLAAVINEFVASNSTGLVDDNGSTSDWIEIYNNGSAINLAGYSLTDDASNPSKFVFPNEPLGAQDYLVVIAGDDADPTSENDQFLYTGFGLSSGGEYIALYDPSGNLVSEFGAGGGDYPAQATDVSYGFLDDGTLSQPSYFATPTPGSANANPVAGIVERVNSSVTPGFYEAAFTVTLSTDTAGATIRYTTDGSTPTATNGSTYLGPINIDGTTNLRAVATKAGSLSVVDRTWSYLFLDDVLDQNGSAPNADWPSGNVNGQEIDYGIDPQVIAIEGEQAVKDALLSIPSWSITTDVDNLFDPATGIYVNALEDGADWERPASVELLQPDGSEGFQVNAGIRVRGGFSRNDDNPKHAFRLFFRGEYGDSELNYPVHGDRGTDTFEKIDLRTAQNYSWSKDGDDDNNFIAEVISRQNQGLSGQPVTQSSWLHLYVNGQYWGLFQTQERADANFGATYLGGDADNFDVIKPDAGPVGDRQNEATDGNLDAYERLFQQAFALDSDGSTPNFINNEAYYRAQGLNVDGTRNDNYEVLLDVDNLISYMTEILYSGNRDAPISNFFGNRGLNNYYAMRDRTGDAGFIFFVHDAEHSLNNGRSDRNGPFNDPNFEEGVEYFNPQTLHQKLMANADYRIQFADYIQESFFNDGIYTTENVQERWDAEAAKISSAIIAESARWGDAKSSSPLLRSDWVDAVTSVRNGFLANRNEDFLEQLQGTIIELKDGNGNYTIDSDAPLFSSVDAPNFRVDGIAQHGGEISAGALLDLTGDGAIFYTTDGSDPRLAGGGVNPNAIAFDGTTTQTTLLDFGEAWNYLDDGSNQGTAWRSSGFNDSSWASGDAQLGYGGNSGEVTTVGYIDTDPNELGIQKNITTYFRKTFTATTGNYSEVTLNILRDDGAVVYLNGTEIARSNIGSGAVTYTTPAVSTIGGGNESAPDVITLDLGLFNSLLQNGSNTLAVEIHQQNEGSSDISFDIKLIVEEPTNGSGPITLNTSTNVLARALSNGEWSAVNNATFVISAPISDLRISEINYNPADPNAAEIAAGFDNNDEFEFIEIFNSSTTGSINLNGVQLADGVSFTFGDYDLLAGERVVVAEDMAAFTERYGSVPTVLGEWTGGLSNGGELLSLLDSNLSEITSVEYGDGTDDPWFPSTDGSGFTLVLNDPVNTPVSELGQVNRWRASTEIGGTPGGASIPLDAPAIVSFVRDGGSEVRPDLWTTLDVTFSADVAISASALQVVNDSAGGSLVDLSGIGFSYNSNSQTATWDFSALPVLDAAFYTATLDASLVTAAVGGLSLDGDANGTGGDDYSDSVYVAIPGDANLDGMVNVLGDAFILVSNLNSTGNVWTDGDFNADGIVNVLGDAFTLVANLGRSVLPPALATSQFASSSVLSPSPVIVQSTLKQNDSSKSEESPEAPLAESTTPVLAGSQQLDDAFASDDWLI